MLLDIISIEKRNGSCFLTSDAANSLRSDRSCCSLKLFLRSSPVSMGNFYKEEFYLIKDINVLLSRWRSRSG